MEVVEALREAFGGLTEEAQEALMQTLGAPCCGTAHSNDVYVRRVLRCTIQALEAEGVAPSEALVMHYASLMTQPPVLSPSP